jgi:hypothetical protein
MEYLLDLTTLIQILSRQQQSGELLASRVYIPGMNELCQAHLDLVDGAVRSCVIRTMAGSVLAQGDNAVMVLSNLVLKWNWTMHQTESSASQTPYPQLQSQSNREGAFVIPYKAERINLNELNALSRTHRKVFGLIDGTRSTKRIAEFLSPSERAELSTILRDLRTRGLIAL